MAEQKEPQLTVEAFYEKTEKLNEVFQNNLAELHRTFQEKQNSLFQRLSDEDKKIVIARETEKMSRRIATMDKGIIGLNGQKISGGGHA